MTQACLDRRVARATGETLRTVQRRGFSIANPEAVCHDPEPYGDDAFLPQVVDWEKVDSRRVMLFPQRTRRQLLAA